MKRRASGVALGPVVGRALNIALVSGAVTYVMWVLEGTREEMRADAITEMDGRRCEAGVRV